MTKKPKPKNKRPSKKWEKYSIKNNKIERKKYCPRCGPGFYLADHKDRYYCGSCKYMEKK